VRDNLATERNFGMTRREPLTTELTISDAVWRESCVSARLAVS